MNLIAYNRLYFLLIAILYSQFSFAQPPAGFQVFFEKTYLNTDRNYYTAGEDIWFRAYLVNAQTGIRTNTSANLYVELIAPTNEVVARETLRLENGLANGDFKIPASTDAGKFRLRAYTNWMKNFGDEFFFEKGIEILADPAIKTVKPKAEPMVIAKAINTATVGTNHIYFFPEGGSMVAGLPCRVAFKATDAYGKGISIKGKITANNGDSVTAFETMQTGFGNFTFTPMPGKTYAAVGKYYGMENFRQPLPQALQNGLTLQITNPDGANYIATIQAAAATASAAANIPLRVVVRHSGKTVFRDSVVLSQQKALLNIAKKAFPDGINAITLYDEQQRPQCERLVFVQNANPIKATIITDNNAYTTRQKATVQIAVTDAQNQPVQGRLSLAATDANLVPAAGSNIVSYLMLQSELRGDIENPLQYFDINNNKRLEQMDLLLQTQGWREFIWRRVADNGIAIKYLPEPGITISGRVEKKFGNSGLDNMNVTLLAPGSRGDKFYFTKTDAQGRYFLDGLPLYGRQDVKLTVKNSKNKKEGMLLMDTVLGQPYAIKPVDNIVYDTSAQHKNFMSNALAQNKKMQAQQNKDENQLENVTVTGNIKPQVRLADGGMKYGTADSLFTIQPSDAGFETLSNFIVRRYPGAATDAEHEGFFFYGDKNAKIFPHWIIDGREDRVFEDGSFTDIETGEATARSERIEYTNLPINKVKKVYVVPMLTSMGTRTYAVHLTLLPGAFDAADLTIINTTINGYYEARKYFVPDFSSTNGFTRTDLRSTIFWAPDLKTNAEGKATVSFKNSDVKTMVSVCIEGISDKGIPFAGTAKYEVK